MSDLTASQCGCQRNGWGCSNSLIWIILLSCICGNNNDNCGCGMDGNFLGGGCGDNSMIFIILLLLCCCNN